MGLLYDISGRKSGRSAVSKNPNKVATWKLL
jgi:hypothetical protein